jgi:hypothetical protein
MGYRNVGYAFRGVATALSAKYYNQQNKLLAVLMIANGAVSIGSALLTVIDVSWVMAVGGLVSYFVWNVLMILIMVLIYRESATRHPKPAFT